MRNILITGPSVEPITADQLRTHLRLDTSIEDLSLYIAAARTMFENETGLALINQTWRLSLDTIPREGEEPWWNGVKEGSLSELTSPVNFIELPTAPLVSVTTFLSYAENNTNVGFTDFYTDVGSRPGRVALRNGSVWPTPTRGVNGIEITYVAGFGADSSNVPADIKMALLQLATHFYENREVQDFDATTAEVPLGARNTMKKRKLKRL